MNTCSPKQDSQRRSNFGRTMHCVVAAATIGVLVTVLLPGSAAAYPQTRQGFFLGLGIARGSMTETSQGVSSDGTSGSGGNFRLGWVLNPKFGLGIENNSWVTSDVNGILALGTSTFAASLFPAEGLVLRGGIGAGYGGGAGDGLSGDVGTGWTASAAYEFRVMRTFAIGPEIDYAHAGFTSVDSSYVNIGLLMTWYRRGSVEGDQDRIPAPDGPLVLVELVQSHQVFVPHT